MVGFCNHARMQRWEVLIARTLEHARDTAPWLAHVRDVLLRAVAAGREPRGHDHGADALHHVHRVRSPPAPPPARHASCCRHHMHQQGGRSQCTERTVQCHVEVTACAPPRTGPCSVRANSLRRCQYYCATHTPLHHSPSLADSACGLAIVLVTQGVNTGVNIAEDHR